MLLNKKVIIEGIIFPLFLFYACEEPKKPESYVARVNDSFLTEADLYGLIDSQSVAGKNRTAVIKNWVKQEVLYQEAVKQGITEDEKFKSTIENSKRKLAAAMILEKFSAAAKPVFSDAELEKYYKDNQSSFRLPFNAFYLNRISFSDRDAAVQFRTQLMSGSWKDAAAKFAKDKNLVDISNKVLISEQDVYPSKLLRILEGLYSLQISIVIPDERGYYLVVQLLNKFPAQSVPPFEAVKDEVERRYKAAIIESTVEDFIMELYTSNRIEINR
jgi:hypothetical protein